MDRAIAKVDLRLGVVDDKGAVAASAVVASVGGSDSKTVPALMSVAASPSAAGDTHLLMGMPI